MKLQFNDLTQFPVIDRVNIHSVDWMIYQISIVINGQEKLVYDGEQPFRCRNLLEVRALFETLNVGKYFLLRPDSAYDEMIGQPQPVFSDSIAIELHWPKLNETGPSPSSQIH